MKKFWKAMFRKNGLGEMQTAFTYKTIIIGAILVAAILSGFAIHFAKAINEINNQGINKYLTEIGALAAKQIKAKVDGNIQTVSAVATVLSLHGSSDLEFLLNSLKVENSKNEFDNMGLITADGIAYGTNVTGVMTMFNEHFETVMAGNSVVFPLPEGTVSGRQIICYATPLTINGEVMGVIYGTQEEENYNNLIDNSIFGNQGFCNILDSDGNVIILSQHPNCEENLKNIMDDAHFETQDYKEALMQDLKTGQSGILEYSIMDIPRMVSYTPIGVNDWYVMTVIPSEEAKKQGTEILCLTLVLCGIVVALFVCLYIYTALIQVKNRRQILNLAFVDELTGGINFNKFKQSAKKILQNGKGKKYAFARIDIDNFKIINDMYGFAEGDRVLKNMHKAIGSVLTPGDIYARTQNDNFIILCSYNKIMDMQMQDMNFKEMFLQLNNQKDFKYLVGFTVGVYVLEPKETDVLRIMERANLAHKAAKTEGNGRMLFYDDQLREDAIKAKTIENTMNTALTNGELVVYLQPKYCLKEGSITGAEALIRWQIPNGRLIPPMEFIPVFEKNGFIVQLDLFVLEEVCKLQRSWLDQGLKPIVISVNQSKLLIVTGDYINRVHQITQKYKIPPSLIELELTETMIHDNISLLIKTVLELKKIGFIISIDDFGSGYSSLNMLKEIHADILKIDQVFLTKSEDDQRGTIVLANIIKLASELHMSVVTEGVETVKQAELLRTLGCDIAQGYLFAKPMPIPDFEKILHP